MKCPHCDKELPSVTCSNCGEKTPAVGAYCCFCGTRATPVTPSSKGKESTEAGFDPSDRVLCSDGTCIGVINADGVCNECGKPYEPDILDEG